MIVKEVSMPAGQEALLARYYSDEFGVSKNELSENEFITCKALIIRLQAFQAGDCTAYEFNHHFQKVRVVISGNKSLTKLLRKIEFCMRTFSIVDTNYEPANLTAFQSEDEDDQLSAVSSAIKNGQLRRDATLEFFAITKEGIRSSNARLLADMFAQSFWTDFLSGKTNASADIILSAAKLLHYHKVPIGRIVSRLLNNVFTDEDEKFRWEYSQFLEFVAHALSPEQLEIYGLTEDVKRLQPL